MKPSAILAYSADSVLIHLKKSGFENLRIKKENSSVYLSFENSVYRWNVSGIVVALDTITSQLEPTDTLHIVLLNRGIPQLSIRTIVSDWIDFRMKKIPASEYKQLLSVHYDTGPAWKKIKDLSSTNASYGKLDLVLYNQIKLLNTHTDRFFDTQINFAPTLELSLWKGAKGTLQWLFPLTNSTRTFGKEGNIIRPGFATINQQFQIHPKLYTHLSVGLFNNYRSGIDWETIYHLNQWISLRAEAAYTGYVNVGHYAPADWTFTTWDKLTWSAGGSYFNRQLSVQTGFAVQRFLAGDTGIRLNVTRLFGEVSVGLFALFTEGKKDAGFNIAIPLPGSKRPRWGRFRIMLPEYFDWEYSASTKGNQGSSFETRPDENSVQHFFNPVYIQSQLLNY